jgi:hypothetical protein
MVRTFHVGGGGVGGIVVLSENVLEGYIRLEEELSLERAARSKRRQSTMQQWKQSRESSEDSRRASSVVVRTAGS